MRDLESAIRDAVARGAIAPHRADYWRQVGTVRPDIPGLLDSLESPRGRAVTAAAGHAGADYVAGVYGAVPAARRNDLLYAPNPLLAEARQYKRKSLTDAMAENPEPPRLFGTTDLPLATASGLDPAVLAALPWPIRRPVAEAPTRQAAFDLISKYEASPEMAHVDYARDAVNASYVSDFRRWLGGTAKGSGAAYVTSSQAQEDVRASVRDDDTAYRLIFGEER